MNQRMLTSEKYKPKIQIFLIMSLIFIASLNISTIQLALPSLVDEFQTNYQSLSISVASYFLLVGAFSLVAGKLGDVFSTKAVLICGILVFGIGAIVCSYGQITSALALGRSLQGLGMASITANGISIIRNQYVEAERGHAMSLLVIPQSLAYIVGPSLAGYLVEASDWQLVFLCSGLFSVVIGLFGIIVFDSAPEGSLKLDYLGALLVTVFILSTSLLFSPPSDMGWTWRETGVLLSLIVLSLGIYVYRGDPKQEPIIPKELFKNKNLAWMLLASVTYSATMQGFLFLMPFYFESLFGFQPARIGFLWMIMSVAILATNSLSSKFSSDTDSYKMLIWGVMLRGVGLCSFAFVPIFIKPGANIFGISLFLIIVYGCGAGLTIAPLSSLVVVLVLITMSFYSIELQ